MKIALIPPPLLKTPPSRYGGLEQVVYDLGCALLKAGHDVTLVAPHGSNLPDPGKVIETGQAKEDTKCNWVQEEIDHFGVYAARVGEEFDIIHDHTWFGTPYLLKIKKNVKICHTHHGHLNWNPKAMPKKTEHLNLIAISQFMANLYISMGFQSKYVYNGIEIEKYPFKKEKGDRFLFVGRFSEFKMPHVAIDLARDAGHPIDLVGGTFVDNPNYLDYIKHRCALGEATIYLDAPHEVKLKMMQDARALIVPSKFMEPFGLVAAEALACGTPVVALNDGALREVVGDDGIAGYVGNTYDDLLRALKQIDGISPEECRKRGELFSREKMAENYVKLYEKVVGGEEW